jgi:ABC-type branched-subunit amino acid transport system ATPase component
MPPEPDAERLQILLVASYDPAQWHHPEAPALVLTPDATSWNDFTRNFRAALHFAGFETNFPPISMRFMLKGRSNTSAALADILDGRTLLSLDELEGPFVSLLASTQGYREIVERLGFTHALASLRRLHDAVVYELEPENPLTAQLIESADFAQGVLREDSAWVALRQGSRYLTPFGAADIDDAAQSFTVEAELPGIPRVHRLHADFGSDFPLARRSLVIVGENGVGKTRLFAALIRGLQRGTSGAAGADVAIFDPRPAFSRLIVFSSVASDKYPTHVPPWSGVDYRFHRMIGPPSMTYDDLAQSLLDCMRTDGDFDGVGGRESYELLEAVLTLLGVKDDLYVEVGRSDTGDILPDPIHVGDQLYLPFFGTYGEQRRLQLQSRMIRNIPPIVLTPDWRVRHLSSGEQALLRFAAQAIGSLRRGSILLFDEPETHLHPRYVSLFMRMLDTLLKLSGSIAVIATHSPFVVREVPARRVRIVRKDNYGEIDIQPPGMQTFGASIDMISQFIFGDVMTKHPFQEALDEWLDKTPGATVEDFRKEFEADLNAETLSYFAQIVKERSQ